MALAFAEALCLAILCSLKSPVTTDVFDINKATPNLLLGQWIRHP